MTSLVESLRKTPVGHVTTGQLREVLAGVADDTALHLGVLDHQRFNTLLGTMPITSARVMPSGGSATLILHVPTS
jgi:hypothetical protein